MTGEKKILIAEDDTILAKLILKSLERAGFAVKTAPNGVIALEMLAEEHFDALIADWLMPELDGLELITLIRKKIKPAPICFVITASDNDQAYEKAMFSGADGFLAKPISPVQLITILNESFAKIAPFEILKPEKPQITSSGKLPPFPAVAIVSSTGGPPVLAAFLSQLSSPINAVVYIVQHGPEWMFATLAKRLASVKNQPTSFKIMN